MASQLKSALKHKDSPRKRGNVSFGEVNVREFDREIYMDSHGLPKVRMGPTKTTEYRRRLESWESEHQNIRRVGEDLRTDLAELGRSLFMDSHSVNIVRETTPSNQSQVGMKKRNPLPSPAFAVMSDGTPVVGCEGWLWKMGTDRAKWKKRWFELKPNGLLMYYDKKGPGRTMKGACCISEKSQIVLLATQLHKRSRCFKFTNLDWKAHKIKKRARYDLTLQVTQQSLMELERWTNVFRTVRGHVYPDCLDWIEVMTNPEEQLGIELRVHEDLAIINRFFAHAPMQMRVICCGMRLVAINGKDMRNLTGRQVFSQLVGLKGQAKRLAFAFPMYPEEEEGDA